MNEEIESLQDCVKAMKDCEQSIEIYEKRLKNLKDEVLPKFYDNPLKYLEGKAGVFKFYSNGIVVHREAKYIGEKVFYLEEENRLASMSVISPSVIFENDERYIALQNQPIEKAVKLYEEKHNPLFCNENN